MVDGGYTVLITVLSYLVFPDRSEPRAFIIYAMVRYLQFIFILQAFPYLKVIRIS